MDNENKDSVYLFPMEEEELEAFRQIAELVRIHLPAMTPEQIIGAANLLRGLESLPKPVPYLLVQLSFKTTNRCGNYGWVSISLSEDELELSIGEHFYDSAVGGDTESQVLYRCMVGDEYCTGSIGRWWCYANDQLYSETEVEYDS